VIAGSDPALLSQRARLALRVRASRAAALGALAGCELRIAGHVVRLGAPSTRALHPHATLYAHKVAAQGADEPAFMAAVQRELEALEIAGHRVCGRHQRLTVSARELDAFSLMLHGLSADASLRLQQRGLGPHRLLGCGVFVPHKSAAAVGSQDF
jgi:CRISPR-associated protein Cas6